MTKSTGSGDWQIRDNTRSPYNPAINTLFPNGNDPDFAGSNEVDFLSNGFKIRHTDAAANTSSITYIYAAFAEHPFGGVNTAPASAR